MPRGAEQFIAARAAVPHTQALIGAMLPFLRAGEFEAGERLPSERDLAERFAVSRNTMR